MKLDHIVILLSNLETGLPFYARLLPLIGFSEQRDHAYVNAEGIYIDIRQASEPDYGYRRYAPGLNHLGFTMDSLNEIITVKNSMQQAGFPVAEIQTFEDSRALFLKDMDGMRIELACYQ